MGTPGARAVSSHTREVRADAIRRFRAANDPLELPPVVVVIAALDEAPTVGAVVRDVPRRISDLDVATLVVDDGSTDGTAAAARRRRGRLVVRLRAQPEGTASRCASATSSPARAGRGSSSPSTGTANGVPPTCRAVLAPVVAGEADFVIGSRVLGSRPSRVPRRGAPACSRPLVRVLTRVQVTDPLEWPAGDAGGDHGRGAPGPGPVSDPRSC